MKETRPPTRPDQIQDSFEDCIDSLILKCQLYRAQAEEYRNDCIEGEGGLGMNPRLTFGQTYMPCTLLYYDRKSNLLLFNCCDKSVFAQSFIAN